MPERIAAAPGLRDLRRGQVLAAARALVAQGGLEALTFGALENRLEFTRGVITHHFRDKDEIVAAVLGSAIEEIDRATSAGVRERASAQDALRAILSTKVRGFLDHPEAGRILLSFWGRLHSDPGAVALNATLYRRYREEAATFLERRFRIGPRAPVLAALMVGAVLGIVLQTLFEAEAFDVDAAIDEAARGLVAAARRRSP